MIDDQLIDEKFQSFIRTGNGENELKQLYESMPYLDQDQQRILTVYKSLAVKYNSDVLNTICNDISRYAKENRKLGLRWVRQIEALSLYKHFRGYKAQHSTQKEDTE